MQVSHPIPKQEEYTEYLNQETLARWQEAEQGKVVTHQAMSKWLNTWGTDEESDRPPIERLR